MLSILGSSSTTRTRVARSPLSAMGSEASDTVDLIIRVAKSRESRESRSRKSQVASLKSTCDSRLATCGCAQRPLPLLEREREIRIRQIARPTQPARAALAVLRVVFAPTRLLLQILRQVGRIRSEHDLLQVVGQQQRLGT